MIALRENKIFSSVIRDEKWASGNQLIMMTPESQYGYGIGLVSFLWISYKMHHWQISERADEALVGIEGDISEVLGF